MPQWRNWQTRYVQGVVGISPWGFKSLLRHLLGDPIRSPIFVSQIKRDRQNGRNDAWNGTYVNGKLILHHFELPWVLDPRADLVRQMHVARL